MKKAFIFIALFCFATFAFAQGKGSSDFKLNKLMDPKTFNQCGLKKLSPAELANLESWLIGFSNDVAKIVSEKTIQNVLKNSNPSPAPVAPIQVFENAIESNIDGEFNGWEGESIFKLQNGQIWQQAEYAYMYHYAYSPEVTIYKTDSGFRMKVEDVEETILVQRIK